MRYFLLFLSISCFASNIDSPEFNKFFKAISKVESSNNPNAVGDGGRAKGVAQIHPECLIDSNQFGKTNFSLDDRLDPNKSKIICFNYLSRYKKYHNWEFEKMARFWNGFSGGIKYPKRTDKYWGKVKKELNNFDSQLKKK